MGYRYLNRFEKPKRISGNYDYEYGQCGPVEELRYTTEFGRPEFICLWCKRGYVYEYCPSCGKRLSREMACASCGFDFKKSPPFCMGCYEPTCYMCSCGGSVPLSYRYCPDCGRKMSG